MDTKIVQFEYTKVLLENGWNSKQMIKKGEAGDDSARLP